MSLTHSPKIVTDSLVFHYDMLNTNKSWKGCPTTNLITNPIPTSISGYTAAGGVGTLTLVDNAACWYRSAYEVWGAYLNIDPFFTGTLDTAAVYSLSFLWKSEGEVSSSLYSYNLVQGNGVSVAASANILSNSTYIANGWYQFKYSFTPANAGIGAAYNRVIVAQASPSILITKFYLKNVQFEKLSYASPFTPSSRSTAQAIFDLVGGNIITASSLTYASDNTFSFNGTTDYLTIPDSSNLSFPDNKFTFDYWVYFNNLTSSNGIIGKGGSGWEYAIRASGTTGLTFTTWPLSGSGPVYGENTSPAFTAQTWYHHSWACDGTNSKLYINGTLSSSTAKGSLNMADGTQPVTIGRGGGAGGPNYLNGKLSNIKIYKRGLTAAEVTQNFNATRGRYGL
jgi:hypothetical protein